MVRLWVCGVVVVAVVFSSLGWSAPAMAKEKDPLVYAAVEFLWAEGGAILGGAIGLAVDSTWFWPAGRVLGAGVGVTSVGQSNGVQGNVFMAFFLPGVSMTIYPAISLLFPEMFPTSWPLDGPFFALFRDNTDTIARLLALPYGPFVPALLAVYGFNIGATMKDTGQPASLPWTLDLPVFSLEF